MPRKCCAVMRRLFEIVDQETGNMEFVSERAGVAKDTISGWRRGLYAPKLANVQAVLGTCGYKLVVVAKRDDEA